MDQVKDMDKFTQEMIMFCEMLPTTDHAELEQYKAIINDLKNHVVPDRYPHMTDTKKNADWKRLYRNSLSDLSLHLRDIIIYYSGHVFISTDWIVPLSKWIGDRSCLEIMAGTGYLSKTLQNQGVSILATDNYSWKEYPATDVFKSDDSWTDVENLDCIDAINKYGVNTDIIICSWPYRSDDAYNALLTMRKVNPKCMMIYIGEINSSVSASDSFYNAAIQIDDESFIEAIQNYHHAFAMKDFPFLFK